MNVCILSGYRFCFRFHPMYTWDASWNFWKTMENVKAGQVRAVMRYSSQSSTHIRYFNNDSASLRCLWKVPLRHPGSIRRTMTHDQYFRSDLARNYEWVRVSTKRTGANSASSTFKTNSLRFANLEFLQQTWLSTPPEGLVSPWSHCIQQGIVYFVQANQT
jgi:hypothetical protein